MSTDPELLDSFHQERKESIGSTDSAAILGVSPFKSAYDVWLEKTTDVPPREPSLPMFLGTELQGAIAKLYTAAMGTELERVERQFETPNGIVRAHVDFIEVQMGLLGSVVVEAKTSRSKRGWGERMTEQVPRHYWIQVQHQMACIPGVDFVDIAVLFGHDDFRVYRIPRNQDFINQLIVDMEEWWQKHVVEGQPPPVDGSSTAERWLRSRYPKEKRPDLLPATADLSAVARELLTAKEQVAQAQAVEAVLKQRMMDAIGDDYAGAFGAGWKATWKQNKSSVEVDWKGVAEAYDTLLRKHYEGPYIDGVVSRFRQIKEGKRPFIIEAVEPSGATE